jgi:hypothetical protein
MIKNLIIFTFLMLFDSLSLHAIHISQNSPHVKQAFHLIQNLPEARQLIQSIEKEGSVKIEILNLPQESFDAFWDGGRRTIRVNAGKNEKLGVLICSILFELHNASTNQQLKKMTTLAANGMISKDQYVESIERMEHENAIKTCALLNKGISINLFPPEAYWPILPDFEDHYKIQQIHGHSAWIAAQYDSISPRRNAYMGTIPPNLTRQQKKDLLQHLRMKNQLAQEVY